MKTSFARRLLVSSAVACVIATAFCLRVLTAAENAEPTAPPEARQFDFWIGEWDVTQPDGKVAGSNRIEPILGGRALQEHWTGRSGLTGTSLNVYDADTEEWRQFWVDSHGGVLRLSGGLRNGAMVLEGERMADGNPQRERITWTANEDGTVRQLWEYSKDNGTTWAVAFDGMYRRK